MKKKTKRQDIPVKEVSYEQEGKKRHHIKIGSRTAAVIGVVACMMFLLAVTGWIPAYSSFVFDKLQPSMSDSAHLHSSPVATNAGKATPKPTSNSDPLPDDKLEVHFIDVGQADCILIRCGSHSMLVDAGDNADVKLITDYLDSLGIKELDCVIGTHPHEDHIGSLDTVIREYKIHRIIMPDVVSTSNTFSDVVDAIQNKKLSITKAVAGRTYKLGEAQYTILGPVNTYENDLNAWSVGIRLTFGENSFVMCGDAEEESEIDMINAAKDISADVFKAGHHGSSTSSSDKILDAVDPKYIIITCGRENDYGHPHREVMDRIKERGISMFRTDLQGTIIAYSDGKDITFNVKPSKVYTNGFATDYR